MEQMKRGTLFGVGVGPGDPELMTLKAVRTLEQCPVIAAPRTASGETLALNIAAQSVDLTDKEILPLSFTMARDPAQRLESHREAVRLLCEKLDRGLDVAVLNLGDLSIYSTWSYLMGLIKPMGYDIVIVPGVPSFCAVAAKLGISLVEQNEPLHISSGRGDLEELLDLPGTKVLMKSGSQMPGVLSALEERDLLEHSSMVRSCGLAEEAVCQPLTQFDPAKHAGYFSTVIVKEDKP